MKKLVRLFCLLLPLLVVFPLRAEPPKIVVVVVLDQFPFEYLSRFGPYFSAGGFNYLRTQGAEFTNARYQHAYTKTAPGHAAISTGAYPHLNGITANRWYDRDGKKGINAVDDPSVSLVGRRGSGRSPKNLLTYTIGDMLRIQSGFRSKVFGLANKDRSAVLLGGKLGTAYWIEDSSIVTSTYYMSALPGSIAALNSSSLFRRYFGRAWTEKNSAAAANICDADDAPYESGDAGMGRGFPHIITGKNREMLTPSYYEALDLSPYSTEILFDIARTVCLEESLGLRGRTDMLCIGVAATDVIGHAYGPMSHEVFDNALRTDSLLGSFFSFLDHQVGLANCLIALSSDHGIAPIPEFITKNQPRAEAGRISSRAIAAMANEVLDRTFGGGGEWIEQTIESELTIDRAVLRKRGVPLETAEKVLKDSLSRRSPIAAAFTAAELEGAGSGERFESNVRKSFCPTRSGDVMLVLKPYFIMSGDSTGTNHGQPYDYDAHVPLMLAGREVRHGVFSDEVSPVDLAPTIAAILGVEFPPSREGKVLTEALK